MGSFLSSDVDRSENLKKGSLKFGTPVVENTTDPIEVKKAIDKFKASRDSYVKELEAHKKTLELAQKSGEAGSIREAAHLVKECQDKLGQIKTELSILENEDSANLGFQQTEKTTTADREKDNSTADGLADDPDAGQVSNDDDAKADALQISKLAEGIEHEVEEIVKENASGKSQYKSFIFVDSNGETEKVEAATEAEAWKKLERDLGTSTVDMKHMGIKLKGVVDGPLTGVMNDTDPEHEGEPRTNHEGAPGPLIPPGQVDNNKELPDGTVTEPEKMENDATPNRMLMKDGISLGVMKYGSKENSEAHVQFPKPGEKCPGCGTGKISEYADKSTGCDSCGKSYRRANDKENAWDGKSCPKCKHPQDDHSTAGCDYPGCNCMYATGK